MKVIIFSTNIDLTDRYNGFLSENNYKLITDYNELIIAAQKESIVILMSIEECKVDREHYLKTLIEFNAYIMILDTVPNYEKGKKLISMGIKGYGNLMINDEHLKDAINTIIDGNIWLYPEFINETVRRMNYKVNPENIEGKFDILSDREKEVAFLVIERLTYNEIATILNITLRTVKAHTQHIYEKFKVPNRLSFLLLFNT